MANVLLIDDEENILKLSSLILQTMGHTFQTAANGQVALDLLDQGQTFDLIVTDLIMPGIDGLTLAHKIGQNIPVIIASAMCHELKPEIVFQTPAVAYLAKPFDLNTFKKTVSKVLAKVKKLSNFQPQPSLRLGGEQLLRGENILSTRHKLAELEPNNLPTLKILTAKDFNLDNIIKLSCLAGHVLNNPQGGLRLISGFNFNDHVALIKQLNQTNLALGDLTGIFLTEQAPSDIMQNLFDRVFI